MKGSATPADFCWCAWQTKNQQDQKRSVFCTGGRDGNIMVWDTRCNKKDGFYRQVKQITGAHNIIDKQTPSKLKKKKQSIKGLAPSVDFQQSVTVVLLQDEHTLISAGAVDGVIKVWDLRKNYATYRQDPVPSRSFSYPGNSTRKLGYSSLILDSTGTSLFANCTDDNIYMFSMPSLKNTPVSSFSGHQNSSFYVKSSISPDDQFLISGSSDQTACIWKVSEPQLPPMMLHGHLQEVTSVSWCPSDFTKISTCSDDNTVKIWRLRRGIEEENWLDKSNLVGWSCQKKVGEQNETGTPNSKHGTPAKVLPSCSPPISSPQAAACAPAYLGDLPLPTNTPTWSSVKPPASTACTSVPARQKETTLGSSSKPAPPSVMSIRQWVTKTPHLSPPVKGAEMPTPQGALAGVCEATAPSKSPHSRSEMRAKRRLDSSKEENAKCLKSCNCVIELYPVFKKFRLEHNTLVIDSESCEKDWLTHSGPVQATPSLNEPPPPGNSCLPNSTHLVKESCGKMTGKENGFPGKRSWLSDLGAKQQTNKIRSPNGSGNSAHLLRNLSIRQQEAGTGVTSPGPVSKFSTVATTSILWPYRSELTFSDLMPPAVLGLQFPSSATSTPKLAEDFHRITSVYFKTNPSLAAEPRAIVAVQRLATSCFADCWTTQFSPSLRGRCSGCWELPKGTRMIPGSTVMPQYETNASCPMMQPPPASGFGALFFLPDTPKLIYTRSAYHSPVGGQECSSEMMGMAKQDSG
ncbi:hypothetical protein EYD10_00004 [Varanus komodoensis]|nr:hypothetical protein EYD10_00004 [Varanus komodoensis]